MKIDDGLYADAKQAADQTQRSTTAYFEYAAQEQIKKDEKAGIVTIRRDKK